MTLSPRIPVAPTVRRRRAARAAGLLLAGRLLLLPAGAPRLHGGEAAPPGTAAAPVETEAETEGPRIIAVFEPREEAVLSSLVSAPVVEVHHRMGETVARGEPLLTLDGTVFRAEVRKAEAELRRAEARLEAYERLVRDGSVTRAEYEEARAAGEIARADLAIRRHELAACVLAAPYGARVARVHVHAHEIVEPGRPLVEILDDTVLYAVVLAPAEALGRIELGRGLPVRVRETGREVRGVVSHVGARIDPASATAKIRIRVENDGTLRAGMRGAVRLGDLAPRATSDRATDPEPEPHE
jgi:RND family efflux transporter MFP subunit